MPDPILDLQNLRTLAGFRNRTLRESIDDDTVVAALAGTRRAGLLRALSDATPGHEDTIREALERMDPEDLARNRPEDIARDVLDSVDVEDDERSRAEDILVTGGRLEGIFGPGINDLASVAVADLPELRPEIARAEVAKLTDIAGLRDGAAKALVAAVPNSELLTDQRVGTLVIDQALTKSEADRIGLVAGIAKAVGDDIEIVERLSKSEFSDVRGRIKQLTDILRIDDLALAKAALPDLVDEDRDEATARAQAIKVRIEERFPTEGLAARLKTPPADQLRTAYGKVRTLLKDNPDALNTIPSGLDESTTQSLSEVRATVNAYPGLGMRDIVSQGTATQSTVSKLNQRVAVFEGFAKRNAEIDLRSMDFSPDSKDMEALDFRGVSDDDKGAVLSVLKARARTLSVGGSVRTSAALMKSGLHSSLAIADMQPTELATRSGITAAEASIVIATSRDMRLGVSNIVGSLADELRWDRPDWTWIGPLLEDVTDGLKDLPGYADLFGDQSYCNCAHCDSVLSPAAYFVDLMTFVDEKVTQKEFTGAKEDHALKLQNRRPDLWTVPLTCDATHDLVPTLEIINEILEAAIATREDATIDGDDIPAILDKVYGDLLPTAVRSFVTPFDRRVASADLYLRDFDTDRAEIVSLTAPDASAVARNSAALSLSVASYEMITTRRNQWAYLRALYRNSFPRSGNTANPFDVQDLLPVMDVDRETLGAIIEADFVQGSDNIRINAQKRSVDSVQNDIERVVGMTRDALDRMHRFWRLARALDWHPRSLGVVLERIGGPLNDTTLTRLVAIQQMGERLELDTDEVLSLTGVIPTDPVGPDPDEPGLMDRLFNGPAAGIGAAAFPAPAIRFVHPALRDDAALPETGPNAGVFVSQRLRVAFGISDEDLLELILMLAPALGIDPDAAAEDDRGFLLSGDALSLLYRHALLADALRLSFAELGLAIRIANGGNAVTNAAELTQLIDVHDQFTRLSVDLEAASALMGLLGDPVETGQFIDVESLALDVVTQITTEERTVFAPTVFAFLDGVSEDQSRAIVDTNAALFEPAPRDMLRLAGATGLAPAIAAPSGGFPSGITEADLQNVLDEFNLRLVVPDVAAAALDMTTDKLSAIDALVGANMTAQVVIDGAIAEDHVPLRDAMVGMVRALAAFEHEAFTADRVGFVDANRALFDLADPVAAYSRAAILSLAAYLDALLFDSAEDHPEIVDAVLTAHTPAGGFTAADTDQFAQAAGGDVATIRIFEAGASLPANAIAALDLLRHIVSFAGDRGLSADAMALLASPDPVALGEGAESLKAALQLRLVDAESFEKAMEVHEDALRGRRRDALTDYMIRDSNGRFEDRSDLYNYYLIDPDMEGCARTSRVVSAIGSLQSYVHRVVLNLEQDRRDPDAANHVHVSPTRIPADEWEWRKNYRVWEANRKIFLWPENYMLPELRDNKTPQFEELEKTLLQQDITEQTVLDAYASYLRGFEEVAGLKIAGAYHEHVWSDGRDVLHLFGCTSDDPPTYYYWTIENLTFSKLRDDRRVSYSSRRKLGIAIPVRDVSPIIYNNRLHLFWLEISTNPWSRVRDGENEFRGYKHNLRPRFSFLKLDGTWSTPQSIELKGRYFTLLDQGLLYEGIYQRGTTIEIPGYTDDFSIDHSEAQDGHTLVTPAWKKVYPGILNGDLYLNIGGHHVPYRIDMFERTGYPPNSTEINRLRTYWDRDPEIMHISGSSSARRIYDQTVEGGAFWLPGSTVARQDFTTARWKFESNLYGLGYIKDSANTQDDAWNLDPSDLGASVARVNDEQPHVVVPVSDWGFPAVLVQKDTDVSFFHWSFDWSGRPYEARRLGTTVLGDLGRTLFYGGVDGLLDKKAQADYAEKSHLITSANNRTRVVGPTTRLDYTGPLGVYFRELFFHIPALLAAHQNSRGDYAASQGWYQAIFDPTAKFDSGVDLGSLSESARLQAERDRVWQYYEFQGMEPPSLRSILTDEDAQEAYRKDPFNPYAIARLRLSAFQKNIVMRYCDNLLDWADSLFQQFTRESVDEAHILYDLVRQILGPRPADAGDCGEGIVRPRNYERIKPHLEKGQDFLIEVENWIIPKRPKWIGADGLVFAKREFVGYERFDTLGAEIRGKVESAANLEMRFDHSRPPLTADKVEFASLGATELMLGDDKTVANLPDSATSKPAPQEVSAHVAEEQRFEFAVATDGRPGLQFDWNRTGRVDAERANLRYVGAGGRNARIWGRIRPDRFTWHIVRQIGPVFCIPRNKDLLALWDRVEDRLYKIHNCRNIDGERVDLALFAPEIDPMALVRARAAGLSLSDILGASAGNLPPYRFTYLVAKARDYVGLVQGFGSKLQSAMEKRDAEELAKLRLTQAINMQNLVTKIRENEVKIAEETLAELKKREEMFEYRESHFQQKIDDDLLPWDRAEQVLTHGAGISKVLAAILNGTSGILHLIPQLGSPFAMKYGGHELGLSGEKWAKVFKDTGDLMMIAAKSASLEAKYAKKRKEWKHGLKLEGYELKQIEKRIKAAEIRLEIAEKALSNHKQAIKDQEELLDFYETKFAGEELYSWMASTLQTIFRQAFNAAMSMARLAEQAYRFERPSDQTQLLELTYWEPGQAGLLSGEKLAIDLIEMEKRYLETNYRTLEITQPFSLNQLNPAALMALREEGECDFTVPELAFDLLYPGQYRRRIRSARLSVACVTGPYVNIPVTLTLTGAKIRVEPTLDGAAGLADSVLRHTVQIATSTAQNDSGTFDFSFSDPRYMPFEGAGAVESTWKLALPKTFAPFDYDTITDVVLHLSYTAESDGVLRERVEAENAALEGALIGVLEDTALPRVYSLRQEFGTAFHQLTSGPAGVDALVALDERALPFPLRGRELAIDRALLLLKPSEGLNATGTEIRLNGTVLSGFAATPEFPGYVLTDATGALATGITGDHAIAVTDAGDLGPGAAPAALANGALEDIVIYVELSLD